MSSRSARCCDGLRNLGKTSDVWKLERLHLALHEDLQHRIAADIRSVAHLYKSICRKLRCYIAAKIEALGVARIHQRDDGDLTAIYDGHLYNTNGARNCEEAHATVCCGDEESSPSARHRE
jgi:hypothetical protein